MGRITTQTTPTTPRVQAVAGRQETSVVGDAREHVARRRVTWRGTSGSTVGLVLHWRERYGPQHGFLMQVSEVEVGDRGRSV